MDTGGGMRGLTRRVAADVLGLAMSLRQARVGRGEGLVSRWRSAGVRLLRHPLLGWRRVATVVGGGLALSLAYHVVFGQNGLTSFEHKRQETRELAAEQQRLVVENDFYRGHVARLKTDPDAIEHQAREELHYTRPGEVIYTMPATAKDAAKQ